MTAARPAMKHDPARRQWLAAGVAAFAGIVATPAAKAQDVMGDTRLRGAGSTFVYPAIAKWALEYQRAQASDGYLAGSSGSGLDSAPAGSALEYEPVGSLAGMLRLRSGAVDFAATDVPLSTQELTRLGLGQFPIVVGGIAVVVNIDGVGPGAMKLNGPVLADIFLGKIANWSDPAIKALNPDLRLPDAKVAVLRRADGSGTTFNFTDYLSKVSPAWKDGVGSDLLVKWPVGAAAKGNDGIAQAVRQTRNAIGYVDYAQALQARLSFVQLGNKTGRFIAPSAQSFQAAAAQADWAATPDFSLFLTDMPAADAYPMVATVFVLMSKRAPPARTRAAIDLFRWSLDTGGDHAARLGYVPLPASLVTQIKGYWQSTYRVSS